MLLLLLLLFLLMVFLMVRFWHTDTSVLSGTGNGDGVAAVVVAPTETDTTDGTDGVLSDTLETQHVPLFDSVPPAKPEQPPPRNRREAAEGAVTKSAGDTTRPVRADSDSSMFEQEDDDAAQFGADPCALDTLPPWVWADPAGGLHRATVYVRLDSDKPASIEWRIGEGAWEQYTGVPLEVSEATALEYRAQDSCGNRFGPRIQEYVFDFRGIEGACPRDMELVEADGSRFCIDRFEWPNRYREYPATFVSYYQALDSCHSVGKRLCSAQEWRLACSGPHGLTYPYGSRYEDHTCTARDTARAPSGSKRGCRGYFDVYDMAGNVAEWTSTRAAENRDFFYVMGGFWASGPQGTCTNARYSYFPQNRHNPVGFRCCKDAGTGEPR